MWILNINCFILLTLFNYKQLNVRINFSQLNQIFGYFIIICNICEVITHLKNIFKIIPYINCSEIEHNNM